MLESRASYGYYGSSGGYTGETPPKSKRAHKSGYHFREFTFQIESPLYTKTTQYFMVTAISTKNAIKQMEAIKKTDSRQITGFKLLRVYPLFSGEEINHIGEEP